MNVTSTFFLITTIFQTINLIRYTTAVETKLSSSTSTTNRRSLRTIRRSGTTTCHDETKDFVFVTDTFRLFGDFYDQEYDRCVFNKDTSCIIDFSEKLSSRFPVAAAECAIMGGGKFITYDIVLDSCQENNTIDGLYDDAPDKLIVYNYPQCVSSTCEPDDFENYSQDFADAFYCKQTYSNVVEEKGICPDKEGQVTIGFKSKNLKKTCKQVEKLKEVFCTYPEVQSHCGTTCKTCPVINKKYCGDYKEKFDIGNMKKSINMKKCWQVEFDKEKWCAYENAQKLCPKACGLCSV